MMHETGGESGADRTLSLSDSSKELGGLATSQVPHLIVRAGERAARRFVEFFAATIRNRNTRAAYGQAVGQFCAWCERRRLTIHYEEFNWCPVAPT